MSKWTFGLTSRVLAVCALAIFVQGCEFLNELSQPTKSAPDEFSVYQRAPLSIPPDFSLRPPRPGASRPQNLETRGQARAVVLGRETRPSNLPQSLEESTPGVRDFLQQSGAIGLDPNIRDVVSRETSDLAEESKGIANQILFWSPAGEYGRVIDADMEMRRLREREALEGVAEPGATPAEAPAQAPAQPTITRRQ